MEDLKFDKNLKKAITAEKRAEHKEYLKSVEKTVVKPKKTNWLIAASIIAIIGFSGYFIFNQQPLSNQELYAENFTPYQNVVAPIVRNRENLNKKALVFAHYELGEYQKAIEQFNDLTSTGSTDIITINFYKANAYLMIGEYQKAKDLLQQIIDNNNQEWKNESLWYLGLAYLKLDEKDNASLYLQKLQQQKSFKINEVNNLLNEINKSFNQK